jgi:hypothetical protein
MQNTGPDGKAIVSDVTTNGTAGVYVVSASAEGVAQPAYFDLSNTTGTPDIITASLSSSPQSTEVNTSFPEPLTATLTDSSGVPIGNQDVTFTVFTELQSGLGSGTGAGASASFSTGGRQVTVQTSAVGVATSPPLEANDIAGAYYVTVTEGSGQYTGDYAPAKFTLNNIDGAPGTIIPIAGTTPQAQQAACCSNNPFPCKSRCWTHRDSQPARCL